MLVGLGIEQCAIKCFDSLGFNEWRLQRLGDVIGQVLAADRNDVGAGKKAVCEQRDRRRAGAEIDACNTELTLFLASSRRARLRRVPRQGHRNSA